MTSEQEEQIARTAALVRLWIEQMETMISEACSGSHRYIEHRDGKPPWCPACRYTAGGERIKMKP